MASLKLEHIYKVYDGGVKAVNDLNLTIDDKDFVVFVGPSGCGKSTTLRMIAGLEAITSGNLYIGDTLVNELPPKDRDITMVFQNYALYPHKTVYENMAFGLRLAHVDNEEIDRRIKSAAEILGLTDYLTRKPKALSGGQRQRVALGRSIVREPKVFLLDEPLSNLDAKLRVQMRSEITKLHRRLQTTFIYVTHDQTEALTMGSKIVVMKDGLIQQIDTPSNLYDHPTNIFVATFLGAPQMNLFNGKLIQENGKYYAVISSGNSTCKVSLHEDTIHQLVSLDYIGKDIKVGIRPEEIYQSDEKDGDDVFEVFVDVIEKLGSELIVYGKINGTDIPLVCKIDGRKEVKEGDIINVKFHTRHIHLFDYENQYRISGLTNSNYLSVKYDGDKGIISFDSSKIKLSEEEQKYLLKEYQNGKHDVILKINTQDFSLTKENDDDVKVEAKIKIIEKSKDSMLIYIKTKDRDTYLGVKLPLIDDFKVNDDITLYVKKNNLTLMNKEMDTVLKVKYPILDNKIETVVTTKNGVSKFKLFNNNVTIKNSILEEGKHNYVVTIPYDNLTRVTSKKDIIKGQNLKLKFNNESVLGAKTVLYLNDKNIDTYYSFVLDKQATCFSLNKYGYNLDVSQLDFEIKQ